MPSYSSGQLEEGNTSGIECDEEEANPDVLYQTRHDGRGSFYAPRLVTCDLEQNFGSLGSSGTYASFASQGVGPPVEPLCWDGNVMQAMTAARHWPDTMTCAQIPTPHQPHATSGSEFIDDARLS